MKIISRKEAKAQGLKRYFTGKPCSKGNITERYLSRDCLCVDCKASRRESSRRWYFENPESREANKERTYELKRKWVVVNKEKVKGRWKKWRKNNPERVYHYHALRRARKKGAAGSHTLEEWKMLKLLHGNKCAICGEEKKLTKDHIIPLTRGGSNYIENIQPLCISCNSKKHTKLMSELKKALEF